jgi:hypothetical protein
MSDLGSFIGAGAGIVGSLLDIGRERAARKWTAREQRLAEKRAYKRQVKGEKRAESRQRKADIRAEKRLIRSENREQERYLKYSDPAFIRRRAEKAGFNPLLFTGQAAGYGGIGGGLASGTSSGYGGFSGSGQASIPAFGHSMGDDFANAGQMIATGFASMDEANLRAEENEVARAALEMENQRMTEVMNNLRFQPKVARPVGGTDFGAHNLEPPEFMDEIQTMELTQDGAAQAALDNGNPLDPGDSVEESTRLDKSRGGAPGDLSIHHRPAPWSDRIISTERPGMGQRLEDDQGEGWGPLMNFGYNVSDMAHNLSGHMYHPGRGNWVYENASDGMEDVPEWWSFNPVGEAAFGMYGDPNDSGFATGLWDSFRAWADDYRGFNPR